MIRLLGWGDEAVPPRAAAARGFVPQLEALDGRVVPSGVKIDFCLADTGVPPQVSTVTPPPDVVLLGAPASPGGAAPVQVPDAAGFHRVGDVGLEFTKTDKDKFEPYKVKMTDILTRRPIGGDVLATAPVHVPGEAWFDRAGGTDFEVLKTDKDKFEPYLQFAHGSGALAGPVQVAGGGAAGFGLVGDTGWDLAKKVKIDFVGYGAAVFGLVGGTWFDASKTDKDKFEPYAAPAGPGGASGLAGPVQVHGSGEAGLARVSIFEQFSLNNTGPDVAVHGSKWVE